jgi:hypothetical protein
VDLRISDLLQRSPNRQMELFNKLDDLGGFNCRLARHSRRAANSGKCREKGAAPQLARLGYHQLRPLGGAVETGVWPLNRATVLPRNGYRLAPLCSSSQDAGRGDRVTAGPR